MKAVVTIPHVVLAHITVDIADTGDQYDNTEAAIEAAYDHAGLQGFAGNGGWDKLVGVLPSSPVSLEALDDFPDPDGNWCSLEWTVRFE